MRLREAAEEQRVGRHGSKLVQVVQKLQEIEREERRFRHKLKVSYKIYV